MTITDEYGFVTKGRQDRAKHPPRRAPSLDRGLIALVRQAVDERIKLEVQRILAEKRAEIAYQLEGMNLPKGPDVRQIILTVCDVTGANLTEFLGPRRSRNIAWPRKFGYYVMKKARPDLSLPSIGKALGNRDHTTVLHGLRSFEELRDEFPFSDWLVDPRIIALLAPRDKSAETTGAGAQ
jgi:hypothetical protein